MPYVVTENCQKCRFTDCVSTCPVDCFYADDKMLYIHPDECIDCGACAPACPVKAIYDADELPESLAFWEKTNSQRCEDGDTYSIVEMEEALPTANSRLQELGLG